MKREDLQNKFEVETKQGRYNNEGLEPEENNGTYNDAYVRWLEDKLSNAIHLDYLVPSSNDPEPTIEDCRNVINEDVTKYNTSHLVEINNAYIEDTEVDGYDVSGRVSKLWVHKDEYKNLDKYKIS